jgi:hypothetical protein
MKDYFVQPIRALFRTHIFYLLTGVLWGGTLMHLDRDWDNLTAARIFYDGTAGFVVIPAVVGVFLILTDLLIFLIGEARRVD